MFTNDISIINKRFNSTTKKNDYIVNHVKGFWSSNNGISISNTMLVKSSGVIVRILMSEPNYVDSETFKTSTDDKQWTLKNDDYIVKGIISEPITDINSIINSNDCKKITNIAIKDYGSDDMQHFEVSGE